MTRTEFIKEIRKMADELEKGSFHFIEGENGYIFANKNYGEVTLAPCDGIRVSYSLFNASVDEKKADDEKGV